MAENRPTAARYLLLAAAIALVVAFIALAPRTGHELCGVASLSVSCGSVGK